MKSYKIDMFKYFCAYVYKNCYKNIFFLKIQWFLWATAIYLFLVTIIFAGGLSSPCGVMVLGNLKIGQEYSLKQLLGYPYNVSYRGNYPVDLKIDLVKPDTATAEGYEPIPDINWIKLQKDEFSLDPGQTAETDIFIKIPNDENLLGKKYRVIISPYTMPPKGDNRSGLVFTVGLSCYLKLSISPKPPTEQEIREQKKRILSNYVNFSVSPERIFIYDLKPNKVYDLTKEFGEVIKLINATQQDVMVTLTQIKASEIGIFLPEDTIEIEDLNSLKFIPKKFKLKKDSIKSVNLTLSTKGLEIKSLTSDGDQNIQTENLEKASNENQNRFLKRYFTLVRVNFSNKYTDISHYVKFYIELR